MGSAPPERTKAPWGALVRWILPYRGRFAAAIVLGGVASVLEVMSLGLIVPLLSVTDAGILENLGPFSRVLPLSAMLLWSSTIVVPGATVSDP